MRNQHTTTFSRHIQLPELLYERVLEVCERVGADGEVMNDECQLFAGDVFVMKTPGGGGCGQTSP